MIHARTLTLQVGFAMNSTHDRKTFTVLGASSDTGRLVADSLPAAGQDERTARNATPTTLAHWARQAFAEGEAR